MNFGKFEILADLGQGAMGKVYRAHDPILDRPVALKTVAPALLSSKDTLARFRREAKAAARLQHPNVTVIYESDRDPSDGHPYLVMEFLDGTDLRTQIQQRLLPGLKQKLEVIRQVCAGLDYAHAQGVVVHRDVKPANIQVTGSGTVKIMDFGIAKLADEIHLTRNLTQANIALGTLPYLSPEQIRGGKLDRRSDLWSVGVVLYETLCGQRPFDRPELDDDEVMKRIVLEEPDPLPPLQVEEEDEVRRIVEKSLEKDRDRRYQTAGEMGADLKACLIAAGQATPLPRKRKSAADWFDEGKEHYQAARFPRAADCFRRVLLEIPDHPGALSNIDICERAHKKLHAEELYKIGMLLFKNREYGVAAAAFEDLFTIEPDNQDARTLYAWARRELARREEKKGLGELVADVITDDRFDQDQDTIGLAREAVPPAPPPAAPPASSATPPGMQGFDPPPVPQAEPVEARERSTGKVAGWLKKLLGK